MSSHLLLRASAGTGKTYRLVDLYVREILDRGLAPGEIVAITFTRKAAAELRSRIRAALTRSGAPRALLEQLGRAPIGNFHGLALQLMRGFGFVMETPVIAGVLGERGEDRELFMYACEEAWFADGSAHGAALERVAAHLHVGGSLPEALWSAVALAREDARGLELLDLLGGYDPEGVRATVHAACMEVRARLVAGAGEITGKSGDKLREFLARPVPARDAPIGAWAQAWSACASAIDRRGKLGKLITASELDCMRKDVLLPAGEELCARLVGDLRELMAAALAAYERAKLGRRAMDFADVVERVVRALATRPEVHGVVRERFKTILVDEAQDTNRLQRQMVRLLAGLEGPAAATSAPARLVVVGDVKQAIYTFRGADPQSFAAFAGDVEALGGEEDVLEISYRSRPTLVHAINHIGEHLFPAAYERLAPRPDEPSEADAEPAMTWIETPADGPTSLRVRTEAAAVARHLRAALDAGARPGDFAVLLAAMSRAPLYAAALTDVGVPVLLGGGGGLYAQPEVVDTVSLLVWITDPRATLQAAVALRSPLVGLSDSGLLRLLAAGGRERRDLERLHRGEAVSVGSSVGEDEHVLRRLAAALAELVPASRHSGAGELLELVDAKLHVRASLLALEHGERRAASFERLVELAHAHDGAHAGSAARFARRQLENVERKVAEPSVTAGASERAVLIGTVHQAKGLEYRHVVLADLAHGGAGERAVVRYGPEAGIVFRPRLDGEALDSTRWRRCVEEARRRRDEELARLLYVAVTRARHSVTFVGTSSRARDGFAKILQGWRDAAVRDAVLVVEPMREQAPPARAWDRSPPTAHAEDARAHAPALRQRLVLPVTDLAAYAVALERGAIAREWRASRAPGFDTARGFAVEHDPPLDPLARGRLAHVILAALHRRVEHRSDEAFVDAELEGAGYAPDDERLAELRRDVLAFLVSAEGRAIARLSPEARRHELPFQISLAAPQHEVLLHGQLDLLYWDEEGPVIVDYKHAHAPGEGLMAYWTQLDAYALAVEGMCEVTGTIRARLVFLRDRGPPLQRLVSMEDREALRRRIHAIAHQLGYVGVVRDLS